MCRLPSPSPSSRPRLVSCAGKSCWRQLPSGWTNKYCRLGTERQTHTLLRDISKLCVYINKYYKAPFSRECRSFHSSFSPSSRYWTFLFILTSHAMSWHLSHFFHKKMYSMPKVGWGGCLHTPNDFSSRIMCLHLKHFFQPNLNDLFFSATHSSSHGRISEQMAIIKKNSKDIYTFILSTHIRDCVCLRSCLCSLIGTLNS